MPIKKRKAEPVLEDVVDPYQQYIQDALLFASLADTAGETSIIKKITGQTVKRGKPDMKVDGIYFDSYKNSDAGHFKTVKNGLLLNSYTQRYQSGGSNGFCQTFAMMNWMGLTGDMVPGAYTENSRKCVAFLAGRTSDFLSMWKSKARKTALWYPTSTESQLAEDLIALKGSRNFQDILQKEETFLVDLPEPKRKKAKK